MPIIVLIILAALAAPLLIGVGIVAFALGDSGEVDRIGRTMRIAPYPKKAIAMWVAFAVALIAWCVGLGAGIRYVSIRYAKANCAEWGEQTEREVRFIQPTTWDWGCYVHTDDGWVRREQVRKLEP